MGIVLATKSKRAEKKSGAVCPVWDSDLNDQSESSDDLEDEVEEEADEKSGAESSESEPKEIEELGYQSDVQTDVQADAETNAFPPIRVTMSRYACNNG